MAIRNIEKIPTYESKTFTRVPQGQVARTDVAKETPEYNNWGALGSIASGLASIGKNIANIFEKQDLVNNNRNLSQFQLDFQNKIETMSTDIRGMEEISPELQKFGMDYINGMDISDKEKEFLYPKALEFQRVSTAGWGVARAAKDDSEHAAQIEIGTKELIKRNATEDEIRKFLEEQNSGERYPGDLAKISDDYFEQKKSEILYGNFLNKQSYDDYVSQNKGELPKGLTKPEEFDEEALREESLQYAQSLEDQWNIENGRDPLYSDLKIDMMVNDTISKRDYENIYSDYLTLDINQAVDMLNAEIVYDADGVAIPLTVEQREDIKDKLIKSDHNERTVKSLEYSNDINKLIDARSKGLTYDQFMEDEENFKYITDKRTAWNYVTGEFKRLSDIEENELYESLLKTISSNKDQYGITANRQDDYLMIARNQKTLSGQHYEYLIDQLNLPRGSTTDPVKDLSNRILTDATSALDNGDIDETQYKVIVANGLESGAIILEDWQKGQTILKNFNEENMKTLRQTLNSTIERNKFKDADGVIDENKVAIASDAIRRMIEENSSVNGIMLTSEQLREKYDSIVKILTEEQILKDLDGLSNDNPRNFWSAKGVGDLDRTTKRLISGDLFGLKSVDPAMFETMIEDLNKNAEIIASKDFKGESFEYLRLHDGYMPVYKIGSTEHVLDISANERTVNLIPLKEAKQKYVNLDIGKPVGTILEDMVLTFDGYKKASDMQPIILGSGVGYAVKDAEGNIDETKPTYVLTNNVKGEMTFLPIFSKPYDIAGVNKELEAINEIPKSDSELQEEIMKKYSGDFYKRLFEESRPYNPLTTVLK